MTRIIWLMLAVLGVGAALASADEKPGPVSSDKGPSSDSAAASTAGVTNPVRANAEAARQGEILFNSMNCDGCHGIGATGFVGPSLVDGRWRFGGDDAAVFHSIRDGRPQGMPAYGRMLPDSTIWQLVTWLQAQPLPRDVPTISWP